MMMMITPNSLVRQEEGLRGRRMKRREVQEGRPLKLTVLNGTEGFKRVISDI